ncbi:MAG: Ku protein [Actinomycetota bacterium]|nr:Ku protein [Actinomycetota bacterium]
MKALWKGAITFGLISIPVRLYSAVSEKGLKFHLLHEEDGGRIKYQRTCSKCGKEVSWDDITKGYEYSKDHYVQFSDDELDALDVDSVRAIDVVAFVPLESIDPIYFNKTYYVAPEPSGLKAYRLLQEALEAEGQVGVAKVALREKEHLATVRLKDEVFVLETMHWPDEIREPVFEELDKKIDVRDAEVKMARQLVQQLSDEFRPEEFQDEYRSALEKLVEQKVEGQEITVAPPPEEEPTKVVDLMEALKASVEQAKKRKDAAPSGTRAKKKTTTKRKASAG